MFTVVLLSVIGIISSYRIPTQQDITRSRFLEQEALDSDLILPSTVRSSLLLPSVPQPSNLQTLPPQSSNLQHIPQPLAQFSSPLIIQFQTGFNVQPFRRPTNVPSGHTTIQPVSQVDVTRQLLGQQNLCGQASVLIHAAHKNLGFHFSWCRDQRTFTWDQANVYCKTLGTNFQPVCIEDGEKNGFITEIIARHPVQFIWTGGSRRGLNYWRWLNGSPLYYTKWSPTGGQGQPQPDNREGNEECLAVLKNLYNDGIVWHDVACHHVKPVICEATL
ncbi:L-selectin [Procambarus clarkii]|uniref:L-selectin n=1 Tax=Procambarus clarkii TaxID=6728 RepID=UPI001E674DDD|nr:C-type lectin galactose-binding isoform-like [Procambarus clarkii]